LKTQAPNEVAAPDRENAPSLAQPTQAEVLSLAGFGALLFIAVISWLSKYPGLVNNFGDSPSYMSVASAIRRWDFQGLGIKQFWGLPYTMALVSIVTRISDLASLLLICAISYFAAAELARRLWGGWVAGVFAILNFDWMQRSFLGGTEPLFVALLFGSFLAVRREHWLAAALLASCATVVRPLGLFALVGIGLVLLFRRQYSKLALAVLIGLAIGTLYAIPLARHFGDPLATVHSYQIPDSARGSLFGLPLIAIIRGTLLFHAPWTNLVLTFGWIFFVLAGIFAMFASGNFRDYAKANPVEASFAGLYLLAIFCYNYPFWARGSFPRFAIPVVPFVLLALQRWIPRKRPLLWALGTICPLLAAASAVGLKNIPRLIFR
jgi:hypothetical protein